VGLLPVTGLQLPLISAGGTSTATTLLMIGIMTNAARHEPEAVAALRAGRDDRVTRWLRLPLPAPYVPTRTEAVRDRLRTRDGKAKAAKSTKPAKAAKKSTGKRAPAPVDRPARRARTGGEQPVGLGSPPVGYGAGQRNPGRRARTLEGQRYG
jgi:cell division protein FtsW